MSSNCGWHHLHWLQIWPPPGATGISNKLGHLVAPLLYLVIRWRYVQTVGNILWQFLWEKNNICTFEHPLICKFSVANFMKSAHLNIQIFEHFWWQFLWNNNIRWRRPEKKLKFRLHPIFQSCVTLLLKNFYRTASTKLKHLYKTVSNTLQIGLGLKKELKFWLHLIIQSCLLKKTFMKPNFFDL